MVLPLETPRLLLREFRPEDWVAVHAFARDPEVVRFLDWGPHSEADSQAYIARVMAQAAQIPRRDYEWAVLFKGSGALIGGAGLRLGPADPHSAELSCTLHRLAWGQGLGTELARLMLAFGFGQMEARRVWATCRPENIASHRVMQKAGLRFEEYLQNDRTVRGRQVDSFLCVLTRREWEAASTGPGRSC